MAEKQIVLSVYDLYSQPEGSANTEDSVVNKNNGNDQGNESDQTCESIATARSNSSKKPNASENTWVNKILPNLDYEEAKKLHRLAMQKYAIDKTYHAAEITGKFSMDAILQLKPALCKQTTYVKTSFHTSLKKLLTDLSYGVSADLQVTVFNKPFDKNAFWQETAKRIGIIAPVHKLADISKDSPYYLLYEQQRANALTPMNDAIAIYKRSVKQVLLTQAETEAAMLTAVFTDSFKNRFLDEQGDNWLKLVEQEFTVNLHEKQGHEIEIAWDYEINWLKKRLTT